MAKTLLGIAASPRKFGNSELFIKELYLQLSGSWDLKLIRLPDMDIRPCKACYQCLFGEEKCPQQDDFALVLETLAQADALVVAAPTYLLGANASLKRFLDRGLSFYAQLDRLWGKPAVGVAIAGIEGMEGYTKLVVESFIKLTLGDLRGSDVVYGALPGEIFLRPGGKETARRLAAALTEGKEKVQPAAPTCPICGGDTFRFLPDGQVRCMLCSNSGAYVWQEGRLQMETKPGKHALFLSYRRGQAPCRLAQGHEGAVSEPPARTQGGYFKLYQDRDLGSSEKAGRRIVRQGNLPVQLYAFPTPPVLPRGVRPPRLSRVNLPEFAHIVLPARLLRFSCRGDQRHIAGAGASWRPPSKLPLNLINFTILRCPVQYGDTVYFCSPIGTYHLMKL